MVLFQRPNSQHIYKYLYAKLLKKSDAVGFASMFTASLVNLATCKRESESASVLIFPGMCSA